MLHRPQRGAIGLRRRGTRLRPITHTSAKQLVPIANKPILFYGLEALASAGIREIGLVVGETAPEIEAAVGDGSAWGVQVTYIPQEAPLGLAHTVLISREFLGDDDFVMYLGDNLAEQDLGGFVESFEASKGDVAAHILLTPVADPRQFGVAEVGPDGEVVQLVEKPADPPSDLALVGVYLFTPVIHEAVAAVEPLATSEAATAVGLAMSSRPMAMKPNADSTGSRSATEKTKPRYQAPALRAWETKQ